MSLRVRVLHSAPVVLLASFTAFGETGRGTITGTVRDPAGAVVPSVSVSVTETGTGFRYSALTNQ